MSEEFDIMKPISPHLDIGLTMFDKPPTQEEASQKAEEVSESPIFAEPVSPRLDIGTTMFDKPIEPVKEETVSDTSVIVEEPPPKEYRPPVRSGVNDVTYGYMTAEEASFMGSVDEELTEASPLPSDGPVAAPEMGNALDRALSELQDLRQEETVKKIPIQQTAVPEEEKEKNEEWFPNMTVRVGGRPVHGMTKNIVSIIMGIIFVIMFVSIVVAFGLD